jgi:hypothetical protein
LAVARFGRLAAVARLEHGREQNITSARFGRNSTLHPAHRIEHDL